MEAWASDHCSIIESLLISSLARKGRATHRRRFLGVLFSPPASHEVLKMVKFTGDAAGSEKEG